MKLAVLVSGNGSNLQAIIDTLHTQQRATIVSVISDNPNAHALKRAAAAGIPTVIVDASTLPKTQFQQQLQAALNAADADLVVLAGFMRILAPELVANYRNKMLNIHPSLLPKYPGLNTHQRVLDAGEREHGTTVHIVTEACDQGPILAQARLPLENSESASTLKDKVQKIEHILYPLVIGWMIDKRLRLTPKGWMLDDRALAPLGQQLSNRELEDYHDIN